MKRFYVYLHCRPGGDPFYVGKGGGGIRVRSRDFRNNRNPHYLNTVRLIGEENVEVLVFLCENESEALLKETAWISALRNAGIRITNITAGGDGVSGLVHSEETRSHLSLQAKQRGPVGNQFVEGHAPDARVRAKMSASAKGNRCAAGNKSSSGVSPSPETVAKRAAKLKGQKRSGLALANIIKGQRRRRTREKEEGHG